MSEWKICKECGEEVPVGESGISSRCWEWMSNLVRKVHVFRAHISWNDDQDTNLGYGLSQM